MRRALFAALAATILSTAAQPALAQSGHDLFQQALVKERVDGDLRGAIAIYERIVRDFASDRSLAASALVQLGECYEKLGSTEAQRAYQRVVSEYADQGELVARARARLGALRTAASAGRGPIAQRLLSYADTDINDFLDMAPSPDGRTVAYVNYWDGGVYVRDLASGRVEQVAQDTALWYSNPKWSVDGRRLGTGVAHLKTGTRWIRVIDVASHAVSDVPGTEVAGRTGVRGWSLDGQRLLCYRDRKVVLVSAADGAVTVLVDSARGARASLSPDGRYLAYGRGPDESQQIFVKPVSGGEAEQVTNGSGSAGDPVWSPDGDAIAYNRSDGIWVVPVTYGRASGDPTLVYPAETRRDLRGWTEAGGLSFTLMNDQTLPFRIPVDPATGGPGEGVAELLASRPEDLTAFAWSPDMKSVVFGHFSHSTLSVHAADGRISTYDVAPGAGMTAVWWSRDGTEVQFVSMKRQPPDPGVAVGALNPATGEVREVRSRSMSTMVLSMSADGSTMAVIKREGPSSFSIGVVESGQEEGRTLVPSVDAEGTPLSNWVRPRLSPQGDRILFGRQGERGSVWIVGTDGAGTRRLASLQSIWSAIWDPSGRFIAYTGTVDSATTVLRVVNVATGAQHDIPLPATGTRASIDPGGGVRAVDWSQDGRFVGIILDESRWEFWALRDLGNGTW